MWVLQLGTGSLALLLMLRSAMQATAWRSWDRPPRADYSIVIVQQ